MNMKRKRKRKRQMAVKRFAVFVVMTMLAKRTRSYFAMDAISPSTSYAMA